MECGAGRHWAEEEVKALLTVWSEKRVQNYLNGATRNKAMFIYISNRLPEFGVFRDWKQCRAKYKNLKYEYRTVKSAHNSGDFGKSMKFFQELDAILASEIEPQLGEDEDASYSKAFTKNCEEETETSSIPYMLNAGEICVALEDDDISTTSDDLTISPMKTKTKVSEQGNQKLMQEHAKLSFIPCVAIEGGKHWTDDEVRALLHIWSDSNIQTQLEGAVRNKSIFEEIANKLQKFGIDRDWKQCRTKYKNLKYEYKTVRSAQGSGNTCKSMKFFNELDAILQCRTAKQSDKKYEQEDISEGEHIQSDKAPNQFRVITVNDTGIGRHWSDDEVSALILIWSDENIRQQLEGATRNKEIFEQISRRLMKMGIDRDWKQCRTKYKNLKYEYRTLQRRNSQLCNPKRVMRFYDEVDAILKRSNALQQQKRAEEHCQAPDLNRNNREEKDSRAQNSAGSPVSAKKRNGTTTFKSHITTFETVTTYGNQPEEGHCKREEDHQCITIMHISSETSCQHPQIQVYRDLKEVTPEALQVVKRHFEWVAERVQLLLESKNSCRVVVLMGSISDIGHCEKIKKACLSYGIPCVLRVTSAHKGPDETLRIKAEYEGDGVPTVFVAVAGRSNGLGPVMSGNTAYPVINCPPITADWGAQDIWSSLRMPSGLGCTTVLSPDAAAQFAAQIFGLNNHLVWVKLRASMLNTWISLKLADKKLQECTL
ncbi:Multifunctional protein ADE2 [Acipenser ruthenus]|uniref:Multifunctional protein ADE2 n=1 Tax=Acipenser ruthenus TaxID=7906 RepID=A0A444TZ00_ACIRT|nr:Multifunctional protein ADE2 [Acipenser ruthenus]